MRRTYLLTLFASFLIAISGMAQTTFTNATSIAISDAPSGSTGASISSSITVSGMSGTITNISVRLNGFTAVRPRDIDALLVSPTGQKFVFLGDQGDLTAVSNITFTLDDAGSAMPAALTNGTFLPTNLYWSAATEPDPFLSPAPAAPYEIPAPQASATFATVFNGFAPNGVWTLYVHDDALGGGASSISGGWSIIVSSGSAASTTTTVTSNINPSFTTAPNNSVTFTANISSSSTVNAGTVTFNEGATTLASNVAVNASGQATYTTSSLSEGDHTITAFYNGTSSFSTSNGSISQRVNNRTTVSGNSFCNSLSGISIPDLGNAYPYPSNIFVSGLSGTITKITVSLNGVTATRPRDLDMLLVGPGGQKFIIMGDCGELDAITNVSLILDDAAGANLPAGTISSGTYRPTNTNFTGSDTDPFASPAPAGPYSSPAPQGSATLASIFNGGNPNGTWALYIVDDGLGGGASSLGSWCLNITTSASVAPTTTTIVSNNNPSFTIAPGNSVTFTATVTSSGNPVATGSVTFKEGATTLSGPTTVNGSGQATYTTISLSEGNHAITAEYSGTATLAVSSATVTQVVNNQTVVTGNQYCNQNSGITLTDIALTIRPYPSRIFVSGLNGTIDKITLKLNNFTAPRPNNIDILLVGPNNQTFVVMSDVGGITTGVTNLNLILDDAAGSLMPDDAGVLTSGTFKPTNRPGSAPEPDAFASPAPAGPYNVPQPSGTATFATAFGGINPNGTWSLYVVDDGIGGGNSTIGSWCLTFTLINTQSVVTTTGGITAFAEGNNVTSTPVAIDGLLTITDEGTTLTSGTVSITGNLQSAQDLLAFTSVPATMGNITGTYTPATGILNLSSGGGTATLAQWQAALRSVTYTNTSNTPNTGNRTISFQVNDGTFNSNIGNKTVSVMAVNDDPIITSNGGLPTANVSAQENQTAVTTVTASDADGTSPTYSLNGGADASKFTINTITGVLTFITAPDFENPTDANADNQYIVTVRATDGTASDNQTLTVTVTDLVETPMPVRMTSIKAYQKDKNIQVEWIAEAENNLDRYEVEKSIDTRQFTKIGTVTSATITGPAIYQWLDLNVGNGTNYYRVNAIDKDGKQQYSKVVRVDIGKQINAITVYPNPIKNETFTIGINLPKGAYTLTITNNLGQQVYSKRIIHNGGAASETIRLESGQTRGNYNVSISDGEWSFVKQILTE